MLLQSVFPQYHSIYRYIIHVFQDELRSLSWSILLFLIIYYFALKGDTCSWTPLGDTFLFMFSSRSACTSSGKIPFYSNFTPCLTLRLHRKDGKYNKKRAALGHREHPFVIAPPFLNIDKQNIIHFPVMLLYSTV